VTDLGSSNGVFVNGVRIGGSQPLRSGDEVQIGNTRFRFEC
jgi:pSer/pThr/pTyr-binding forkhead associated (FHA) protein